MEKMSTSATSKRNGMKVNPPTPNLNNGKVWAVNGEALAEQRVKLREIEPS